MLAILLGLGGATAGIVLYTDNFANRKAPSQSVNAESGEYADEMLMADTDTTGAEAVSAASAADGGADAVSGASDASGSNGDSSDTHYDDYDYEYDDDDDEYDDDEHKDDEDD